MENLDINKLVRNAVLTALIKNENVRAVPVASSNKHIHLSREDVDILFGKGYQLKQLRPLSQPGQFACEETLTFEGPKGKLAKMRVLGPERPETQVELAVTDCFKAGIKPVVRMSGELEGTPGGRLIGPAGEVELKKGVIVARRHLHISEEQGRLYGLKTGDEISIRKDGERPVILEGVAVRCGKGHDLEVHIDTDEANAALIKNGDLLEIVK